MKKILLISVLILIFMNCSGGSQGGTIEQQVNVFYVDWGIDTLVPLSPEDVRRQGIKLHLSSPKEVKSLIKILEIQNLKPAGGTGFPSPENARLVVDLIGSDGSPIGRKKTTYYAGWSSLCNSDCSSKRSIDEGFRSYFTKLAK
jgi:hypothetical protein